MALNSLEKKLVNNWQKGFPLTSRPFAQIAEELNTSESAVIDLLADLKQRGVLSRLGAVVRPNTVGVSSLVAMQVAADRLDEVAQLVCEIPQVNHNYERENALNLWFVVTASSAEELEQILINIKEQTGIDPVKLPLEKAYHIDLGFAV